jgi:hypothetical protein
VLGGDQFEGEHHGGLPQFLLGCCDARYRGARLVQRVEGERGTQLTDDVRIRITHQIEQRADPPICSPTGSSRMLGTLSDLGADATVSLGQPDRELAEAFREAAGGDGFDVILDYLWGRPAEVLVGSVTNHEPTAEAPRIRLVQIGEMAGSAITLPAAALRSSGLEIMGSGGGSVSIEDVRQLFPRLLDLAARGEFRVDTEQVPLADIEGVWRRDQQGRRLVVVP